MAAATITIRLDADLKRELESLFDDMGMSMNTAFTVFAKAVARKRKIPFEIEADQSFSAGDEARILKARRQLHEGMVIYKTMEELEAMAANAPIN
ncbi:hypothetical protein FACS1894184_11740 [Clostridia bacterium]|nr:hypothetical protein FACS1894184_11740 [Clostridia bacterium]